ncbi:hypothetical protein Aspvir_002767 [Aspergillus viridinutans]|uniref:Uncharacterized protein n=1 Tax=Aspergillus viridinutans TaxID=75553 RepID=A0A9P3C6V6_ASPVI|nr:uncharacterized protein Aspvir_002767 [Aspergillus viridinutans]GIK07112.1 hypothetical protein Aspvir_002767 [Aspergillus viridinutans]
MAIIFGIEDDLHLSGKTYSWLSRVFYFGFLVWAFPTSLLMQRFPLGKYLGVNIFLWSLFLMLQAAAKNFTQLAVLRVISGAAEACRWVASFDLSLPLTMNGNWNLNIRYLY